MPISESEITIIKVFGSFDAKPMWNFLNYSADVFYGSSRKRGCLELCSEDSLLLSIADMFNKSIDDSSKISLSIMLAYIYKNIYKSSERASLIPPENDLVYQRCIAIERISIAYNIDLDIALPTSTPTPL